MTEQMKAMLKTTDTSRVYDGAVLRTLLYQTVDNPETHIIRLAIASMEPGRQGKLHFHPSTHERYYIMEGNGQVLVGGQMIDLTAGMCVDIPARAPHLVRCLGELPMKYVAFHLGALDFCGAVSHVEDR